MKLVTSYHPLLREYITPFDFENPSTDPLKLEKDMLEFMFLTNGVGLAANQIGCSARMFVMGHRDSKELGQAFFNPIVISASDAVNDMEEGCLSFPNVYVKIKRPQTIKAQWHDSRGQVQLGEFTGYDCKCFLHELDHLNGITFQDRISPLKWAMAVKQSNKGISHVRTK